MRTPFLIVVAALAWTSSAQAQCPSWQEGFHRPGTGGAVAAFADFVDGAGQRVLVLGGTRLWGWIPGVPTSGSAVVTWDGATLQPLGALVGNDSIKDLIVWDDGGGAALYAAGTFVEAHLSGIARWNGATWQPVGGGTNAAVEDLEVFDDGSGPALYAAGTFTLAGGLPVRRVARWNGVAWSAVGTAITDGPNDTVHALLGWDDGSGPALYAGGRFTGIGTGPANSVAKWDGSSWSPVGSGLTAGFVRTLATYDEGSGARLFAGGPFTRTGSGDVVLGLARFDGSAWSTVGAQGLIMMGSAVSVGALAVADLGNGPRLHATGNFVTADGVVVNGSAAWDGAAWSPLGAGASGQALGLHDDGSGLALYVGGAFVIAGGIPAAGVVRWNGATWSTIQHGNGLNGRAYCSAVHDDGTGAALYIGGGLSSAGSTIVRNLARFDGSTWSPVGSGSNAIVYALLSHDDGSGPALYAGGQFNEIGGVATRAMARWNGSSWAQVGPAPFPPAAYVFALAEFDDGTGKALYAAGSFAQAGGVPAQRVAKWDGATWSALGIGVPSQVVALAAHDDGSGPALYVGGSFANAGGVPAARIARWNGNAWSSVGAGFGGNSAFVSALLSFDDGNGAALYVGGHFTEAGGPAGGIARWNGTAYEPLGGGVPGPYRVAALAAFDEGTGSGPKLFAGGHFPSISGTPAHGLARFDGTSWSAVGLEPNADVATMQVHDAGVGAGPALYVMGTFGSAGPAVSNGIAAWSSCGETGRTLCFGDGSGAACPCGNASTPGDRDGCTNSTGLAGRLRASGTPSLANDTLVLAGSGMTNGSALYFQGTARVNGGSGAVFGDGLRCAAGNVVRLAILSNASGSSQYPGAGDLPVATKGAVTQPGVRVYQIWFRDAASFCTPDTFSLTNAVEIVWGS